MLYAVNQPGAKSTLPVRIDGRMPAVSLTHLKKKIELLRWKYTQPDEFVIQLRNLLESYSDHTYRASASAPESSRQIEAYHVPPIVVRQIELTLYTLVNENPTPALELANVLWKEKKEEPRLLATYLLGLLPPPEFERTLQKIEEWAFSENDRELLESLFERGTVNLRRYAIQQWLTKIQEWASRSSIQSQQLSLMALLPLLRDRQFENLPQVFSICTPLFQSSQKGLTHPLSQVLITMAERTPAESVYYIRQLVGSAPSDDLRRLIRRCLPAFPDDVQERIRPVLQRLPS
ncbi:MAG: hypothetical protein KatS3mg047_1277 [Bellilinea sp.]|nr:MAG: hypothetical protein KatS3mg047_1277 [Bellilinea sp.]